jgi:hypothetical protein
MPLPIPSAIGILSCGVLRLDAVSEPTSIFPDTGVNNFSGDRYSDVVKWMAAIDVGQAYAPR